MKKSVFGLSGQRSDAMWSFTQRSSESSFGLLWMLTPTGAPRRIATRTVTFVQSGTPHVLSHAAFIIGALSCWLVRSGPDGGGESSAIVMAATAAS